VCIHVHFVKEERLALVGLDMQSSLLIGIDRALIELEVRLFPLEYYFKRDYFVIVTVTEFIEAI